MAPRWIVIVLLVLAAAGIALTTGGAAASHSFDSTLVRYTVKLADNRPGVASDLSLDLRFSAPSTLPEPFGGIVHRTPVPWGIASDEEVPDGDRVGQFNLMLDNPLIMDPELCSAAPMPALLLKVPLADASSDSTAADYPPFLPPGNHKARWTGQFHWGETAIPINVLVDDKGKSDTEDEFAARDALRIFVGTGDNATDLPTLDEPALGFCFTLDVSLSVAGQSESGVPIAVNPGVPGKYTFAAELTSRPDPTDSHSHTTVLKTSVLIKGAPAGYKVDVRDHNPGVATDLLMALNFRPKSPLPRPFGGVTHRAPSEWGIASDEEVPNGDGVGRLHLRLNVPPTLTNVCPSVLPARPSLALSVPLRDASSDSTAADYPPFLPPGEHKARWTGIIGRLHYGIPVNVLVDETASGNTTMKLFVGRGRLHFQPLAKCFSLDVVLHVAGHSRSGVPVAVNPAAEGTYTFQAHIVTLPKPNGVPKEFDLKAEVTIKASPPPDPCLDCLPDDEDGDAIPDEVDLCPQEPEDVDEHDASDGCPDSGDDDTDELLNLMELLLASDPASQDSDSDGCADGAEVGADERLGGQRSSLDLWDFFDTPDLNATPQRDRMIRIADILRVLDRYGEDGDPNIDPMSTPSTTGYHPAYDRGGMLGPNPWNLAPADGMIRVADIMAVVNQYGHDCTAVS